MSSTGAYSRTGAYFPHASRYVSFPSVVVTCQPKAASRWLQAAAAFEIRLEFHAYKQASARTVCSSRPGSGTAAALFRLRPLFFGGSAGSSSLEGPSLVAPAHAHIPSDMASRSRRHLSGCPVCTPLMMLVSLTGNGTAVHAIAEMLADFPLALPMDLNPLLGCLSLEEDLWPLWMSCAKGCASECQNPSTRAGFSGSYLRKLQPAGSWIWWVAACPLRVAVNSPWEPLLPPGVSHPLLTQPCCPPDPPPPEETPGLPL